MDEFIALEEFINLFEKGTILPAAIIHNQNKFENNNK